MLPSQTKRAFLYAWSNVAKLEGSENTLRAYRHCMKTGSPQFLAIQAKHENSIGQHNQRPGIHLNVNEIAMDDFNSVSSIHYEKSPHSCYSSSSAPQITDFKKYRELERLKAGEPMISPARSTDSDFLSQETSTLLLLKAITSFSILQPTRNL